MKRILIILLVLSAAFVAISDTILVFGFDNNTEPNGIQYLGSDQLITFSGAVSATDQTDWNVLDGVSGTVNFSIGAVGDLSSLSGTVAPVGGSFNLGGNGGGVDGGVSAAYFDSGEGWTFTFSKDVTLTAVQNWGEDPLGQTILTNGTAIATSPYTADFTGADIFVAAGDSLTLGHINETSYHALDEFTITVVPEPTTVAMFGIGGLVAWMIRRFSRR